jgi:hypothetical protein
MRWQDKQVDAATLVSSLDTVVRSPCANRVARPGDVTFARELNPFPSINGSLDQAGIMIGTGQDRMNLVQQRSSTPSGTMSGPVPGAPLEEFPIFDKVKELDQILLTPSEANIETASISLDVNPIGIYYRMQAEM